MSGRVIPFKKPINKDDGSSLKRTLLVEEFEAELYKDPSADVVHYVIYNKRSSEIVMMGQERSMSAAEQSALGWMRTFPRKSSHGS